MILFFTTGIVKLQTKTLDKIIKKNHEILVCVISNISDKIVEYSLLGGHSIDIIKLSEITQIYFANGTTQNYTSLINTSPVWNCN